MTPEAKVKKAVKKMLDDRGAYYFMPATGGYGRSGVPDIVGCHKGIFFGIECKAGDNQPTAPAITRTRQDTNARGVYLYRKRKELTTSGGHA